MPAGVRERRALVELVGRADRADLGDRRRVFGRVAFLELVAHGGDDDDAGGDDVREHVDLGRILLAAEAQVQHLGLPIT